MMQGRICIPVHDDHGVLVAYAGRWAADDIPDGESKYKLPPRFAKSAVLYNLDRVRDAEHLTIVEGYFDVLRLETFGIAAVALMGCTLSVRQEMLLKGSQARSLTVVLDGDAAGRAGAQDLMHRLSPQFFVRVIPLPEGSQPDTVPGAELCRLLKERGDVGEQSDSRGEPR